MPAAAALLLLQGVAEFLKCIYALRTGRWLVVHKTLEELVSREP
jgi:TRAP-type mannitol/chloroaromatic compound transport system permease small subunit